MRTLSIVVLGVLLPLFLLAPALAGEEQAVRRSMEVPNPYAALETAKLLTDGVAIYELIGGIGPYDAQKLWHDYHILKVRHRVKRLLVYLNSPGGSAFAGLAIADLLQAMQADGVQVDCHASGVVASAAVPVLASAGRRTCTRGTLFMVHEASLFKFIASEELRHLKSQQRMLELERERYMELLVRHSRGKLSRRELDQAIRQGTWFDADQALKWGLVDEIR